MSVGLLGGAFDPPHNGHLALADEAVRQFQLERLVVLPTGSPPHKQTYTDPWARFRLAASAFEGRPNVQLSAHELEREGLSYTVDTVRWASAIWPDPIFLVGADEFADYLAWKEPNGVLEHARLGVATRPGFPRERLELVLRELERPDRVEFFTIPEIPISSREIRERVRRGEPIHELVPETVVRAIRQAGLYRSG
ncbi:MAG: nicotinate-nucleotide adenylyltransferase [Actinomycetota bacterium]|nr:nicotinate-nucleotide adenylyltransferase [Actinomycetota bacterium]